IEGEYRLQFRDQRYELDRRSGIHVALENEVHAIKTYIALGQGPGRNRRLLWDPIAKDFPSCIEDSLTVGPEVIGDARWRANRCCRKPLGEKGQPGPVIQVDVGKDNSIDGLPERHNIVCNLLCIRQEELAIEDDQLSGALNNLRVGEKAVLGAYVRVDLDVAELSDEDGALVAGQDRMSFHEAYSTSLVT